MAAIRINNFIQQIWYCCNVQKRYRIQRDILTIKEGRTVQPVDLIQTHTRNKLLRLEWQACDGLIMQSVSEVVSWTKKHQPK